MLIRTRSAESDESPVFCWLQIIHVLKTGPCWGSLHVGDIITHINSEPVEGKRSNYVVDLINSSEKAVVTVNRDPGIQHLIACTVLSTFVHRIYMISSKLTHVFTVGEHVVRITVPFSRPGALILMTLHIQISASRCLHLARRFHTH